MEKEWRHSQEGVELYKEREQLAHDLKMALVDSSPQLPVNTDIIKLILDQW